MLPNVKLRTDAALRYVPVRTRTGAELRHSGGLGLVPRPIADQQFR
jgi:hypothetical protein